MRVSFLCLFSISMSHGSQLSNAPEFQHHSMHTLFVFTHHALLVTSKMKDKLTFLLTLLGSVCAREKERKLQDKRARVKWVCECVMCMWRVCLCVGGERERESEKEEERKSKWACLLLFCVCMRVCVCLYVREHACVFLPLYFSIWKRLLMKTPRSSINQVTYVNKICFTHEWVMSHIKMVCYMCK